MKKASFDAWMNAEYWVNGPKGVDFSSRYNQSELNHMRFAFQTGSHDTMTGYVGSPKLYRHELDENTKYLMDWSYEMGELFTKRLQDAEQTNT